jgi:DNA-binding MarR family transcriptional regulator
LPFALQVNTVDVDFEQDVSQFWSLLFTIVLDGEKRFAAFLSVHHLTTPQFYVLKTLAEQGGRCTIGEIARIHHLTNATMTGLVKRLEAVDPPLVMREQNEADRRSVYVILTAEGTARFLAVQADLLDQVRMLLSLVSQEERQDLLRYLSRYVQVVTEQFPVSGVQ